LIFILFVHFVSLQLFHIEAESPTLQSFLAAEIPGGINGVDQNASVHGAASAAAASGVRRDRKKQRSSALQAALGLHEQTAFSLHRTGRVQQPLQRQVEDFASRKMVLNKQTKEIDELIIYWESRGLAAASDQVENLRHDLRYVY